MSLPAIVSYSPVVGVRVPGKHEVIKNLNFELPGFDYPRARNPWGNGYVDNRGCTEGRCNMEEAEIITAALT